MHMHMKIKQNLRVVLQSAIATFFVALITVAVSQAATTIGNNISTGTVTSTGIVDITASSDTPLTINGATSSTTLAVYNSSTGDLVNVFDDTTEVFTILDGGNVGINDSTPTYSLDVTGIARFTSIVDASYFVATSSSATSTFNKISSGTGNLEIGGKLNSNNTIINRYGGNVGIASSTPSAIFSVGDGTTTATSTIDLGMPCFRVKGYDAKGVRNTYYMWPSTVNSDSGWATSTTSCF